MNKLVYLLSAIALLAGSFHLLQSPKLQSANVEFNMPEHIMNEFKNWKVEYGRKYASADYEEYRMKIFTNNYELIQNHNSQKDSTYTMKSNQFMDMTSEEFSATYLTLQVQEPFVNEEESTIVAADIPSAIDWSAKVTPVKNQGSCGSCWAFSATASQESWNLITGKGETNLSEQQLVDCSWPYGNQGCNGGWPTSALDYVKKYGVTSTAKYAYAARDGTCKFQGGDNHIAGHTDISAGNCNGVTTALAKQPLSVCVDATNWSFYSTGVFKNCGLNINHAVLLTGQDASGNWKVKNSWGTGWGGAGYIILAPGNTCGVCNYATYPY